jgi:uncharacterized protein (DUF983 family)
MFFNTVFTFLPTIFIGIFDQDINDTISVLVPQIYKKGIRQELYNTIRFWEILGFATFHSVVCYAVGFFIVYDSVLNEKGYDLDLASFGTIVSFSAIIVVNVYSVACWHNWTYITHFSLWFSLGVWTIYVCLYSLSLGSLSHGITDTVLIAPQFYLGVLLTVVIALGPPYVLQYVKTTLYPSDTDIAKEIIYLHKDYDWDSCTIGKSTIVKSGASHIESSPAVGTGSKCKPSRQLGEAASSMFRRSDNNLIVLKKGKSEELMSNIGKRAPSASARPSYSKNEEPHVHTPASCDGFSAPPSGPKQKQKQDMARQASLGNVIKKAGDFVKRFKTPSNVPFPRLTTRGSSLTYMGTNGGNVANTGFAFSHDTGMRDMITPTSLGPVREDEENVENLESQPRLAPGSSAARLRRLSTRIQTALRVTQPTSASRSVEAHSLMMNTPPNAGDLSGQRTETPPRGGELSKTLVPTKAGEPSRMQALSQGKAQQGSKSSQDGGKPTKSRSNVAGVAQVPVVTEEGEEPGTDKEESPSKSPSDRLPE